MTTIRGKEKEIRKLWGTFNTLFDDIQMARDSSTMIQLDDLMAPMSPVDLEKKQWPEINQQDKRKNKNNLEKIKEAVKWFVSEFNESPKEKIFYWCTITIWLKERLKYLISEHKAKWFFKWLDYKKILGLLVEEINDLEIWTEPYKLLESNKGYSYFCEWIHPDESK
jgi:hypothetical protein